VVTVVQDFAQGDGRTEFGRVGMTAVAGTRAEAQALFDRARAVLDGEAAIDVGARS